MSWANQMKLDAFEIAFPGRVLEDDEEVEIHLIMKEEWGCGEGTCWEEGVHQIRVEIWKHGKEILYPPDVNWNVWKPFTERPHLEGHVRSIEIDGVRGSYGRSSPYKETIPTRMVGVQAYADEDAVKFFTDLMKAGSL